MPGKQRKERPCFGGLSVVVSLFLRAYHRVKKRQERAFFLKKSVGDVNGECSQDSRS